MPVVFRQDGYRFLFYSDEGDPREPVHVHVRRGRDNAKFWLWSDVKLVYQSRLHERRTAAHDADRRREA
jgi:Domain of unknown function (DUF4160)